MQNEISQIAHDSFWLDFSCFFIVFFSLVIKWTWTLFVNEFINLNSKDKWFLNLIFYKLANKGLHDVTHWHACTVETVCACVSKQHDTDWVQIYWNNFTLCWHATHVSNIVYCDTHVLNLLFFFKPRHTRVHWKSFFGTAIKIFLHVLLRDRLGLGCKVATRI